MEKVYAHREFGLEANIIGCATYELKLNEIFVFGSNLAGSHGSGAARLAYNRFNAIRGQK